MKQIHGGCLCGAVEYTVPDEFRYAGYCHCSDCRRFSGSAFSAYGGVPRAGLRVLKGQDRIGHYRKSEDTVLGFCSVCGSSLYADKPKRDMVHIRLGTLDEAPSLSPQVHSFVSSKAPWFEIRDELPQYPAARPASPG